MTKVEMVRDAINVLGWKAKPTAIAEHIKSKFKVEMSKAHISQTKSAERRHRGERHKAAKAEVASPVANILAFASVLTEFRTKLGDEAIRTVVKTVLK